MSNESDLRNFTMVDVLDAIASPKPSSGAGIAAALALALGTACALKAVNVSQKHAQDEQLGKCGARLQQYRDHALDRARIDAELFGKYLQDGEPRDAAMLVRAAEDFQVLAVEIAAELNGLESRVRSAVVSDVVAAKLLHSAAIAIEALILRESRELRARTMP